MKIQDKLIEPYYIEVDGDNYVICEDKFYTEGKTGKEKSLKKSHGYFYNMDQLFKKLIKMKTEQGDEIVSLMEYFEYYQTIVNKVNEVLKPLK